MPNLAQEEVPWVLSTMSDFPLTIGSIFVYGLMVHGASEVATLGRAMESSGLVIARWAAA